jgi:hypothetical protein
VFFFDLSNLVIMIVEDTLNFEVFVLEVFLGYKAFLILLAYIIAGPHNVATILPKAISSSYSLIAYFNVTSYNVGWKLASTKLR